MTLAEDFWDLLGNWAGTEEQLASPWGPAASARAALTFKLDLGGTAVVQDYRQVRSGGGGFHERRRAGRSGGGEGSSPVMTEFLAHGVFLEDEASPGAVLWWLFDSAAHAPEAAPGTWTDGALELVRTSPRARATHRFTLDGDQLSYAIDVVLSSAGDSEPREFLRGRYERVSGH